MQTRTFLSESGVRCNGCGCARCSDDGGERGEKWIVAPGSCGSAAGSHSLVHDWPPPTLPDLLSEATSLCKKKLAAETTAEETRNDPD